MQRNYNVIALYLRCNYDVITVQMLSVRIIRLSYFVCTFCISATGSAFCCCYEYMLWIQARRHCLYWNHWALDSDTISSVHTIARYTADLIIFTIFSVRQCLYIKVYSYRDSYLKLRAAKQLHTILILRNPEGMVLVGLTSNISSYKFTAHPCTHGLQLPYCSKGVVER